MDAISGSDTSAPGADGHHIAARVGAVALLHRQKGVDCGVDGMDDVVAGQRPVQRALELGHPRRLAEHPDAIRNPGHAGFRPANPSGPGVR